MEKRVQITIGESDLIFETGKIARQANGSVTVLYEGSVILATACSAKSEGKGLDYLPLTVNYSEKYYAAGKIPGGFIKREGRPKDKEIRVSRLIDRPLRPLFTKRYRDEIQVIVTTISADQVNPPDILAINGASLALGISDIPLLKLVGAVRVGMVDGNYIVNPTFDQIEESKLDLVVAGTEDAIVMVEGGGAEVSEDELLDGLSFAESYIREIVKVQEELVSKCGKPKIEVKEVPFDNQLIEAVRAEALPLYQEACFIHTKMERQDALESAGGKVIETIQEQFGEDVLPKVCEILEDIEREIVRKSILKTGKRSDGRGLKDIRSISAEINILPRTHGSALFTRGETQSLAITSLGSVNDEQRLDDIEGEGSKSFMLHYNFPPFSVGEVGFSGGPSRREIGHGHLAERAIEIVMPEKDEFPYTVRLVSEITESNGSSSMASVCSGTLSLLSAGVPIKDSVAGVAMGLVYEDGKYAILTDILGSEDHLGDMDFKVAGTKNGITAFQMDIKISGISRDIMKEALEQAKEGRLFVLDRMGKVINEPASSVSTYAPKIFTINVPTDKIGTIIGAGGKTVRSIIEKTGADIWVTDDGTVTISSRNNENAQIAHEMIRKLTEDVEIGKIYEGKVKRVTDFGAFIEVLPGKEGLCHISKLDFKRVNKVSDVLRVGDTVKVKVTEIDSMGRINLSRKDALPRNETHTREDTPSRRDSYRGHSRNG
ncbi:MAG: polyribonucleotide nucleotidyltransferase [Spirochaetota bacterium]|nr:MAG: polyribonucleotide nucleotidyltransferase [Spirochaetota bacterium]